MFFTQEQILELLQSGVSQEQLAAEFTNALNGAIAEEQRIREEEARRVEEENRKALIAQKKREYIGELLDIVSCMIDECYPEVEISDEERNIPTEKKVEELVATLDAVMELISAGKNIVDATMNILGNKNRQNDKISFSIKNGKDLDSFLKDFLMKNGL